jgi:hypothetical protein
MAFVDSKRFPACSPVSFMVLLGLLVAGAVLAEDPVAPAEQQSLRYRWQKVYVDTAKAITMRRGETKLTMLDQPLMFYTNPVRTNDQHGAILLWTENGRPGVIGSIWSATNRQNPAVRFVTHEWHSLSVDPDVTAAKDGVILWTSGEPGIAWQRLEGEPPPAATRPQRLIQMRSIVRRYTVGIEVEGESDLRLLEQPLYRYPENVAGAVDGAIFAFAMTTDPEMLILLEDRQEQDQVAWHIAFARFGNKAMKVKAGDLVVWSCEAGVPGFSDGKYYLRWRVTEMPTDVKPEP